MPDSTLSQASLYSRMMGVLNSRRLKRYKGSDLTVIERKVTDYYASQTGSAYYESLAGMRIWDDMVRHKDFEACCRKAADILDFGCGAGGLSVALAEHFPEKRIHAIDIGAHAAALIAQSKASVDFRKGSVLCAPFDSACVDLLISRFVIEHTIHPDTLISEAHRILRPGGTIYLLYPQLLLKVTLPTALGELASWLFSPDRLTYLDPQINATTGDADDQDAVWLTNPFKIGRLLKNAGFTIVSNVPAQSLVIARKR